MMTTPPEGVCGANGGVYATSLIVLDAPARMMTMNWAKATHWRVQALVIKAWRDAAADRARELKVPAFVTVRIHCWPYHPSGALADPLGHAPVLKAVIDGLVDAGVLPNDTGREVQAITMHAPARGPNGVKLELRGNLAVPLTLLEFPEGLADPLAAPDTAQ
jgi:crossover junction endodeoxyribonuclease RusA